VVHVRLSSTGQSDPSGNAVYVLGLADESHTKQLVASRGAPSATHASLMKQPSNVPPQTRFVHTSFVVHKNPSLQLTPLFGVQLVADTIGSHFSHTLPGRVAPAATQALSIMQLPGFSGCSHSPAKHTSDVHENASALHAVLSATGSPTQFPFDGSHTPTLHSVLATLQFLVEPAQTADASHVSLIVQLSPSLQDVPVIVVQSVVLASGSQA
jgi:hypothetical protein